MKKYLTLKNIVFTLSFIIIFILGFLLYKPQKVKSETKEEIITINENVNEEVNEVEENIFYVDIKGAVKKPGVYAFNEGQMIVDAIKSAEGLLKSATTKNINLSKKLKSEMVIYIFTTTELKKSNQTNQVKVPECNCETIEINNCIEEETNSKVAETKNDEQTKKETKKININKASLDELQSLTGIGLSKAEAIINYRQDNPFCAIEDLMNVSGIGQSTFDKLKDNITINEY